MAFIRANNVSLNIPIVGGNKSLRSDLLSFSVGGIINRSNEGSETYVTALSDLNFEFVDGDRIGIIGHNGAGKSTLLRVLSQNYTPTKGVITVNGTISSMLAIGIGMDYDFSGYDNIYRNAIFMGLSRNEVKENVENIAEFTELGDYLNMPIRTYSAGMLLRLCFAIATTKTPDILLVDEIFGAGDAAFNVKAKKRMENYMQKSNIFVMASHSEDLTLQYCNKGIVLKKGKLCFQGSMKEAIEYYHNNI